MYNRHEPKMTNHATQRYDIIRFTRWKAVHTIFAIWSHGVTRSFTVTPKSFTVEQTSYWEVAISVIKFYFRPVFVIDHSNDPGRVIGPVFMCVCSLFVYLCDPAITFERNELWPRYLVLLFSLMLSGSHSTVEVIVQSSRSQEEQYWY